MPKASRSWDRDSGGELSGSVLIQPWLTVFPGNLGIQVGLSLGTGVVREERDRVEMTGILH